MSISRDKFIEIKKISSSQRVQAEIDEREAKRKDNVTQWDPDFLPGIEWRPRNAAFFILCIRGPHGHKRKPQASSFSQLSQCIALLLVFLTTEPLSHQFQSH